MFYYPLGNDGQTRLCISTQCGFASVWQGNPVTEEVRIFGSLHPPSLIKASIGSTQETRSTCRGSERDLVPGKLAKVVTMIIDVLSLKFVGPKQWMRSLNLVVILSKIYPWYLCYTKSLFSSQGDQREDDHSRS
jgi:hypothetical protein